MLADAVLATVIVLLIFVLHAQTHTPVDLLVRPTGGLGGGAGHAAAAR